MNKIIISTEATCDLTQDIINKYNIKVAPMHYMLGDKEYSTENQEMSCTEFYEHMKTLPTKTSQINQFEAREYFEKLQKENPNCDILHISVSSNLSGQVNNFKLVAEELNASGSSKICVIDSLCGSLAQGMLTILTCEKLNQNPTLEELSQFVEENKLKMNAFFTVEDLKYLFRNGRLSRLTTILGTMLKIKPFLHLSEDGKLVFLSKVISRKKALQTIIDNTLKYANENECKTIYIAHANCYDDAVSVKNDIENKSNFKVEIFDLGVVIGSHSGPGTLSTFFVSDKRY